MTKGIIDTAKKSVEGEVAKTKDEIKKQFDQVINPGAGKGQKEDGQGTAGSDKEKSEKDSEKDSSEEKDWFKRNFADCFMRVCNWKIHG